MALLGHPHGVPTGLQALGASPSRKGCRREGTWSLLHKIWATLGQRKERSGRKLEGHSANVCLQPKCANVTNPSGRLGM
jgi:hypothetical protein